MRTRAFRLAAFVLLPTCLASACRLLVPPEIEKTNAPPVLTISPAARSAGFGEKVVFTAEAADPDGDELTLRWYVDGSEVAGEAGTVFGLRKCPDSETTYTITATASDGTDDASGSSSMTVSGYSGIDVRVDERNRVVIDGEPFFPIALYWVLDEGIQSYPEYQNLLSIADLAGYGFNVMYPYPWRVSDPFGLDSPDDVFPKVSLAAWLSECADCGVYGIIGYDEVIKPWIDGEYGDDDMLDAVLPHLSSPALLLHYLKDEPENHLPQAHVQPSALTALNAKIKSIDVHHPSMLVHFNPDVFRLYSGIADIVSLDLYPLVDGDDLPEQVGTDLDAAQQIGGGVYPHWVTIQAFGNTDHHPRMPTPAEERFMTYQAIVHGAKGIGFFSYTEDRMYQTLELWQEILAVVDELRLLSPVLLNGEEIRYPGEIENLGFFHGGFLHMLAVNPSDRTVNSDFPLSDASSGIEVMFESRTVTTGTASLADPFSPYATHIYRTDRYAYLPGATGPLEATGGAVSFAPAIGSPTEASIVSLLVDSQVNVADNNPSDGVSLVSTSLPDGEYTMEIQVDYDDGSTITSPPYELTVYGGNPTIVWNSWDMVIDHTEPKGTITADTGIPAAVLLYESYDDNGLAMSDTIDYCYSGDHPEPIINAVQDFWTISATEVYPYIGKSKYVRETENGAPSPSGVYDIQIFPASGPHYTVCAFVAPVSGDYTVFGMGIKKGSFDGDGVMVRVFDDDMAEVFILQAQPDLQWAVQSGEYALGFIPGGGRIYFAIDPVESPSMDLTRLAFSVRRN